MNQQQMAVAQLHVRASELDTASKHTIYALVTLIATLRDVIDTLCDSARAANPPGKASLAEVPDNEGVFPVCVGRSAVCDAKAAVALT